MGYACKLSGESTKIKFERLCYVSYKNGGSSSGAKAEMDWMIEDDHYNEYLSWDTTNKRFNVLRDFTACIIPWVYSYSTAATSTAQGSFYINGAVVPLSVGYISGVYSAPARSTGSSAGLTVFKDLRENDYFYNYRPSSSGYPSQRLQIYLMKGPVTDFVSRLEACQVLNNLPQPT